MSESNILKEDEYKLKNKWTLWFHHIDDPNWSEDSYIHVKDVYTLRDYYEIVNYIVNVNAGMFFFMKNDISPKWQDISNVYGGFWSYRILKSKALNLWNRLLCLLISDELTVDKNDMEEINGISISPKINNSIIKILNRNSEKRDSSIINSIVSKEMGEAYYRCHMDNKEGNNNFKN